MSLSNTTWIRTIAVFEMVGGGVGIVFMIYVAVAADFALNVMAVIPISLGIFVLSLVAGIYLWKQTEFGRKASIVIQFIQLPKFISPAMTFTFSFGFDFFPHLTLVNGFSTIGIQFRFLADGQLFVNSTGAPFLLGISVPAIIGIAKLWNYEVGLDDEKTLTDNPPPPEEYFGTTDIKP